MVTNQVKSSWRLAVCYEPSATLQTPVNNLNSLNLSHVTMPRHRRLATTSTDTLKTKFEDYKVRRLHDCHAIFRPSPS